MILEASEAVNVEKVYQGLSSRLITRSAMVEMKTQDRVECPFIGFW
jgi:hypothetical protein